MSPTIMMRFWLICFLGSMVLLLYVSAGSNAASVTACADLAPQLALSVNPPQVNQPFTIQIAVANKGDAVAGRFRAYLYVDPTQQPPIATTGDTTSFGTFGLAAQEQLTYEYDYTFAVTGTHVIYLWVDRDNQVSSECNEANNHRQWNNE